MNIAVFWDMTLRNMAVSADVAEEPDNFHLQISVYLSS
jgi:hypothetical protein